MARIDIVESGGGAGTACCCGITGTLDWIRNLTALITLDVSGNSIVGMFARAWMS